MEFTGNKRDKLLAKDISLATCLVESLTDKAVQNEQVNPTDTVEDITVLQVQINRSKKTT